jgi:two-component system response regulator NreC
MARLLIADDHALFRSGLRAYLEQAPGMTVVAETGDRGEVMALVRRHRVEVLLMDIRMPGPPLAETLKEILNLSPRTAIIVLTMHEEESYIGEALRAGALGFVLKRSPGEELLRAIEAVRRGDHYIDPSLSRVMATRLAGAGEDAARSALATLTPREREVLELLARGLTNQEVGEKLFISKRTVETHRGRIMEKLGFRSRAELVSFALGQGLIGPPADAG